MDGKQKMPDREPLQISLKPRTSKYKNVLDCVREKRGFSQPGEKPMNVIERSRAGRNRK